MMCVDCGAEVDDLIGGSCPACFATRQPLMTVLEVAQFELCSHCGAIHVGAHWHDTPNEEPEIYTLEEAARGQAAIHHEIDGAYVQVDLVEKDGKTFTAQYEMKGHVQGVRVTASATGLVRRTKGVCNRCSRINGGYFAAILQLRATDRDLSPTELTVAHSIVAAELNRAIEGGNRFAFLTKSGPMHGGFDYYIGDIDAGRNVARRLKVRLGGSVAEAAKLVGKKEGENVHRVTFLIRLAEFSPGDILVQDEVPHAVLNVHPKSIVTLNLVHQRKGRIPFEGLRRLGGREMVEQAVVVSEGVEGVLVLDPLTHRTETILIPEEEELGDVVPVVRVDERLYWVPWPSIAADNP